MLTPRPLGDLALARTAIDPVGVRRTDEEWLAKARADSTTKVLVLYDGEAVVEDGRLVPVSATDDLPGERFLLGVDPAGSVWFAVATDGRPAPKLAEGQTMAGIRTIGAQLDERDAGLMVHAVALANWHRTHPCCARCGARTELVAAGHLRRCPDCAAEHFPRTDPAVIVLVTDDLGRALLGHNPRWPERRFSTVAGFVEPGESLERAVAREVNEEVGLEVVDITYLGSQPWPFPASLMLGFTARAVDAKALDVDGDEITEARWFTREQLRREAASGEILLPPEVSIARRLVEHWWGGTLPDAPGVRWSLTPPP